MTIHRYHKNRNKKIINIIHYKCGYSYFRNSNIFDKVVFKKTTAELKTNYKDWFIFTTVRNPFSRIISLYFDKVVQNPVFRLNNNLLKMQSCQRIILKQLNKPLDLLEFKNISFNDFCKILIDIKDKDLHFKPYYLSTVYNNDIICKVYRLEDFNKIINKLNTFGYKLKNKKVNETKKDNNIFNILDIESVYNISKAYEDDFIYFYPIIYQQLIKFTIIMNNNKEIIINDKNINKQTYDFIKENFNNIKEIKNSFLNLLIKQSEKEINDFNKLLL